jgi:hypothetical protein
MITPLSPVTMNMNTTTNIPFSVSSAFTSANNITVTPTASSQVPANLVYNSNLVIGGVGLTNETLTITPTTNYPWAVSTNNGTATITLTLMDNSGNTSSYSFPLTVLAPVPPVLAPITNQFTHQNVAVQVPLTVTSYPVTNYSASSSNPSLVNIWTFAFTNGNEVATFTPVTNITGLATITVSVNNTYYTNTQSFVLQVNPLTLAKMTPALSNSVLRITYTGVPGSTYNLQSSTNLTTWTQVATVTANAVTGAAEYDVTIPKNVPGEIFYRLLSQ